MSTKERASHARARIQLRLERNMRRTSGREASLLLLEEEKEDGWYCFPLGQKASSDTNRRDVL